MTKILMVVGLVINLIASVMIAYGRIFRSKKTIEKESKTDGAANPHAPILPVKYFSDNSELWKVQHRYQIQCTIY